MDRDELLITGILLLVIVIGLGISQLGHTPHVEPVIIEANHRVPGSPVGESIPRVQPSPIPLLQDSLQLSPSGVDSKLPDINQATAIELQQVPGIGPTLSQNIINYRDAQGPFRTIEDLLEVGGIGQGRLTQIKEYFSVPGSKAGPDLPAPIRKNPNPALAVTAVSSGSIQMPSQEDRIDLNTATSAELQSIPGIGPVFAQRIIDFRNQQGPFQRIEQLQEISGIGPKRFEQLSGKVRIGSTALPSEKSPAVPTRSESYSSSSTSSSGFDKFKSKSTGKIDLNQATQEQLESLPGIGPVLAARIIQYRTLRGGFQSREELKSVSGIGEKKYAQIYSLVEVR